MDDIRVAMLFRIGFEVAFLRLDRIRVPGDVVISGESFVQRSYFFFRLSDGHQALLSDWRLVCGIGIIPHVSAFANSSLLIKWEIISSKVLAPVSEQ